MAGGDTVEELEVHEVMHLILHCTVMLSLWSDASVHQLSAIKSWRDEPACNLLILRVSCGANSQASKAAILVRDLECDWVAHHACQLWVYYLL